MAKAKNLNRKFAKRWESGGFLIFAVSMLLAVSGASSAAGAERQTGTVPHLPLEMEAEELLQLLPTQPTLQSQAEARSELQDVLDLGKRNLDWLSRINAERPEGQKLSFTSAATQEGIPMEAPSRYSPTLILERVADLKAKMPAQLSSVLFQATPLPRGVPQGIAESDYLKWGRLVNKQYQSASRWLLLAPFRWQLESRRENDVRGYAFLQRLENREEKLANLAAQTAELRREIPVWLEQLCVNSEGLSRLRACRSEIQNRVTQDQDLNALYDRWLSGGAAAWGSFYGIPAGAARLRSDFVWDERQVAFPFQDPGREEWRRFLADNIQDEWKISGSQPWQLTLAFAPAARAYLVFQPGATPNVNRLGGDRITMDANQPLTEYNVQWTIRHEFGHVLGFPDCYVEFYDSDDQVMINYQLDTSDLMCSRTGHLKPSHVNELRRAFTR